ncbi:hypothetical protein ABFS82_02G127700 [Erythranthe guttata]
MKHLTDHSHDLKPYDSSSSAKQEDEEIVICSVCILQLSSSDAYACTKTDCKFILHKSCFELPHKFKHKSHPDHVFTLLSELHPSSTTSLSCSACSDAVTGFAFQCDSCDYKMHVKCALLPETVECRAHEHKHLDLYYSTSKIRYEEYSNVFSCDVCDGDVAEGYWTYYCKECDFGAHLDCATAATGEAGKNGEGKGREGGLCFFGLMSKCFCLP